MLLVKPLQKFQHGCLASSPRQQLLCCKSPCTIVPHACVLQSTYYQQGNQTQGWETYTLAEFAYAVQNCDISGLNSLSAPTGGEAPNAALPLVGRRLPLGT